MTWTNGPPPICDDGSLCLVMLTDPQGHEYYGRPIVVCRWSSKLKTTIDPIRLEYEDVGCWAPLE